MISAFVPTQARAEAPAVDRASRWPLLQLFGASVLWLLASAILAAITSIQSIAPAFCAGCPILTYGRAQALAETAFIYGWVANAGLGLALWILARLGGGAPLRGSLWIAVGTAFWNLGLLAGLAGISLGDATGLPLLELPRYVQPLLLAAYGAIGVGGILAWTGRRREGMYAAQWYAVAALFLFPWLFSAAQVMLLWYPTSGVLSAIIAGWFTQGLWTLWIAPLALAAAYYLVPKLTGRTLPAYDLAPVGFWCLLFIGAWTGGRHLIGGPVPAWIGSVAVIATSVMLFHYIVVGLNFRPAFAKASAGSALKFVAFGAGAYVLGGLVDAATALRSVLVTTQFTYFERAQEQFALVGAISMILFGALYYAVPRLTGRSWYSDGLRRAHFVLSALGVILLAGGLAAAGWTQGHDLNDARVSFSAIAGHVRPGLLAAAAGQGLLLLGAMLLTVNFFKTAACPFYAKASAS